MSKSDTKSKNAAAGDLQELPAGFVPGEHDVVIGKGKKFYFHSGNQWLRTLVSSMLEEYKQAQTKSDKSNIISDVVEYVRQHGRFVKRDLKTGKWVFAEPLLCREKCSQTFRDNLAETYRSSNVAKRNKRRAEQQEKKRTPDAKRTRTAQVQQRQVQRVQQVKQQVHAQMPQLNAMNMSNAMQAMQQSMNNNGMANAANIFQQQAQAHQQQQRQVAPIPSNLFDLEMPLWSPKNNSAALLPSSLDFSAFARRGSIGSITGLAATGDNNNGGLNGGLNLLGQPSAPPAPAFQLSGLSSMNLLQNLPDILSNLSQIAAAGGASNLTSNAPALSAAHGQVNPFEPTPFTNGFPPLTGTAMDAQSVMASLETGNLFEPRRMAEKRHSLAMNFTDMEWLKQAQAHAKVATNSEGDQQTTDNPKISAAFAA